MVSNTSYICRPVLLVELSRFSKASEYSSSQIEVRGKGRFPTHFSYFDQLIAVLVDQTNVFGVSSCFPS